MIGEIAKRLQINDTSDIEGYVPHPTLYGVKSNGGIKQWTAGYIIFKDGTAVMRRCHGTEGKKISVKDKKCSPKFVGKANERTAAGQAAFEAESAHKKQIDKGMQLSIEAAKTTKVILPMLAKSYKKGEGKYPAYAQPKLNGVRCLAHHTDMGKVDLISRKNKRYNEALGHLIPSFLRWIGFTPDCIGDGEIYKHGWSLQKISGAARKFKPGISDQLQYWIYDIADEVLAFEDRLNAINRMFATGDLFEGVLHRVPTILVENEEEFQKFHDELVERGFEGAILRQPKGKYRLGLVRSVDLEKLKDFIDHEFEIIGGRPAEGTHEGCVIFRVRGEAKDKDGNLTGKVVEFDVVPKGELDTRRRWMEDIDNLIGKELTVRYFELSDDGVPQGNPVGEAIRDYE